MASPDLKDKAELSTPESQKDGKLDMDHVETAKPEANNYEISDELDRHITRKFDTHVVPWLFGLWLLAFIDRSNIANARIDGLTKDLKLTGNQFNVSLTVFYIPYVSRQGDHKLEKQS